MAPKEGDMATGPDETADPTPTSAFWSRLHTFPMVQSTIQTTMGIYATSKENAYIGKGLGVIEYGVSLASTPVKKVASTIADKYPVASTTAQKLDSLALNCLDSLEKKIPAIHETPTQIVTNVKEGATSAIHSGVNSVKKGASTAIHSGVRRVMKTYPGQKVVNSLDSMITWSETTINENEIKESEHGEDEPESKKLGTVTVRLRNGAVVPLKLYLHMLKMVKHMLANMAGVRTRVSATPSSRKPGSSPRKAALESRRQVTPHKRLSEKSMVSSLTNSAMRMLGMTKTTEMEEEVARCLRQSGQDPSDDCLGRSEKRKHDDEESDDDGDTESMNLAEALNHYDSDIDSDYYPGEDLNDDSLEYNSGDTESDLETEGAGISKTGEPLRQLKGKKERSPSETKPPAPQALPNQSDTTQA